MLIQKEDGQLYYKDGDEEVLASMTDIQKYYKTFQYNLDWILGCYVTDMSKKVEQRIGDENFEKWFWKAEFQSIPENCTRIK